MTHDNIIKSNIIYDRSKKSCLNCKKYFIPKDPLPKYVKNKIKQTWCAKACYLILYPQIIKSIKCRYCTIFIIPKRKFQITCGSKECGKKRRRDHHRTKWKDSEYREKMKKYHKEQWEDSEFKEKRKEYLKNPKTIEKRKEYRKEYNKRKYKDPEFRKKKKEYNRKRRKDPQVLTREKEYAQEKRKDPKYREKMREYQREYRLKNKET